MSEQNTEKPPQFSLRMLLLITALIAVCVGTIVPWLNYERRTRERIIRENRARNQPMIEEVRNEIEREKRANGKAEPSVVKLLDDLEKGRTTNSEVAW